jgi:hypothetical protein
LAIFKFLHREIPEVRSPARRNEIALKAERYIRGVVVQAGRPGRPQRYDPHLLRERIDGLLKELSKRFRAVGVWPDTGSKWAADTDAYLRGWWDRRREDELMVSLADPTIAELPYPEEEIAARLSPKAQKGTAGLVEMAHFLICRRYGVSREVLRRL